MPKIFSNHILHAFVHKTDHAIDQLCHEIGHVAQRLFPHHVPSPSLPLEAAPTETRLNFTYERKNPRKPCTGRHSYPRPEKRNRQLAAPPQHRSRLPETEPPRPCRPGGQIALPPSRRHGECQKVWGSGGFVRIYGHLTHRRPTDTAVAIGCLYRDRREGYRHGGRQAVRKRQQCPPRTVDRAGHPRPRHALPDCRRVRRCHCWQPPPLRTVHESFPSHSSSKPVTDWLPQMVRPLMAGVLALFAAFLAASNIRQNKPSLPRPMTGSPVARQHPFGLGIGPIQQLMVSPCLSAAGLRFLQPPTPAEDLTLPYGRVADP